MNPFMNFSNKHRKSVSDANRGLPVTEIAKILGKMWRDLPQEEKEKYREDYCYSSISSEEAYCGC